MKGVQHGACDYLLKPIRMKELKNIWQHVVRKWKHEVGDIECFEGSNGPDHSNDGHYGGDQTLLKKRKDVDNKHDEKDSSDPSSTKKARVVWTVELHQKFVNAVNQIGIDSDSEYRLYARQNSKLIEYIMDCFTILGGQKQKEGCGVFLFHWFGPSY